MSTEPADVAGLYRVSYELSLRALDQQERVLNELRARTGTLLAASSLVASFLGARAASTERLSWLAALGLGAFALSVLASVFILMPRSGLIFALRGTVLLEEEFGEAGGLAEVHRRLAYWLEEFRDANQDIMGRLFKAFWLATAGVLAEVAFWATQLLYA
ncbi:MAG: hypothetical protein M3R26_01160 [Actinomycetota bacterium]|nr:hypothetical protein [Actinomycetota bacterium]